MHGHGARRREFMTAIGCAVLWPFASQAHQAAMPVIGSINSKGLAPQSALLSPENGKAVGRVWAQPTALALSPPPGVVSVQHASG
jgi:hypothetical protein